MAIRFPYGTTVHVDLTVTDQVGAAVTNATVEGWILDKVRRPEAASGVSWPVSFSHQGGGVYRYTTTAPLVGALFRGRWYARFRATSGAVVRSRLDTVYVM
jgi:hypothetical protein